MSTIYYNIQQKYKSERDAIDTFRVLTKPKEDRKSTFIAYKNGTSQEFDTLQEAKKFSNLVEPKVVIVNLEEMMAYETAQEKYRNESDVLDETIDAEWTKEMRTFYKDFNDAQFDAIMSLAYTEGHSSGNSQIECYFDEYATLVKKCLAAANK